MKEIPLTQGFVALVDDEDFELVSAFKWYAGVDDDRVYARRNIKLGHRRYAIQLMHSFILNSQSIIDHRDGNGLNNQRSNLRLANDSLNSQNRTKLAHYGGRKPTSKYKGVSFHRRDKVWNASVRKDGVLHHLGTFREEYNAAQAYNFTALELFGEFARLNVAQSEGKKAAAQFAGPPLG